MKIKRILASILCVAMVLSTMVFPVFAEDVFDEATLVNALADGGTVIIDNGITVTPCYTDANSFWGEAQSNSTESLVIEIYENETKIASASLNNVGGIIDGDVYVTWHINFGENNDEYWNVEWAEGYPKYDMNPTAVKLVADGTDVAENNVFFNGPDNLNKIVAIAEGFTGGVVAYKTLNEAIGNFNGRKVNIVRDVTESIESFNGCTLTTNIEGGVTVTSTYDDWLYANDFNIGSGVTVKAGNFFYDTEGVNTVEGTLEVAEKFYHGYDAKTTVQNGGNIEVGDSTILRYNENADSGLYIYGDGDDSTIEFDCDYYIGAYSGTFYAENANVEAGYFLLKNSYDSENYADAQLTLDDSSILIKGTSDGQDSFIIDDKASVILKNNSTIEDVRDFNILSDTNLTLSVDGTSMVSATNLNIADGVPFGLVDNGDGTFGIKKILTGTGTVDAPYAINDIEDLKIFREEVNAGNTYSGKYVTLTADIDLNNEEWAPIGNSANNFQGVFDGAEHKISNLSITGYNSNVGLFGVTTNGEIKNLTVENAKVSGRLNVGVVAGTPYTSKYTNINVTGHIEVNGMAYVGGVGGKNAYANWTDVTVNADDTSYVKANSIENETAYRTYVGGVIGFMGEGGHSVTNVSSNIDVYGSTCDIGGIAGIAHYGNKFINCSSCGDIYMEDANKVEIGGITGVWHNGGSPVSFENCLFTGKVYIAGQEVKTSISGPSYSDNGSGKLTIRAKVTLNGAEKETFEQAILEAKEMTEPAVIDLLGNSITVNKAYVLNNNITFKNGVIVFDGFNGLDPGTYEPSGINYAVMTIGGNITFDNCLLTGINAKANEGIFVLAANGIMSLTNGSKLNVINPTATAVIYSEASYNGRLVVADSKINIDGKGNGVRGLLSLDLDADNSQIDVKNITDNAMRNVKGTIDNSEINIDGAEYGIKNKGFNEVITVTDSIISVKNVSNSDNAGIYLENKENFVNTNSIIDAKIYIEGGTVYNTLTFETNGGSVIPSVTDKEVNSVVDLSVYRPEKSGYTFAGWYSDAGLTQNISSVTLDDVKTVYAKWNVNAISGGGSAVAKYDLTFDTNGGSAIAKISKAKNTTVDLKKYTTSKEGYTFEGWYSDKELTNKITSVKLTENTTIYAKWTKVDDEKEDDDKTDTTGWKNPFTDVSADSWYYESVRYAEENKLMNGTSENTFSPNSTLTRAMLVTVLYRLEGEPATNKSIPFGDVDMGAYYGSAVSWAKQNGIVSGITETEFAPGQNISREQIAAIIYRYAQHKGYDVSCGVNVEIANYDDCGEVSQYAISAIKYVVASGVLKGKTDRTLNPRDNATRAEIATILQRFIEMNKD